MDLTPAELKAYHAALTRTHEVRVRVSVLDLSERPRSEITAEILDGAVNVDADSEVTRSASLTFFDPGHTLKLDPEDPDHGAIFLNRMIRIRYGVYVSALGRWVDVPVFTGPITSLSRDGATVEVEAQGKESLANQAVWRNFVRKKGTRYTTVIRHLMQSIGEDKFAFSANPTRRLAKTYVLALTEREFASKKAERRYKRRNREIVDRPVWEAAQDLADTLGRQLFYDGDGYLRLRNRGGNPVWTFRDGDGGSLVSAPQVSYSTSELRNAVQVRRTFTTTRGKGKHKKELQHSRYIRVEPPNGHPLSPAALGRNGRKRYLPETIDGGNITHKRAVSIANARLNALLDESVAVTFDSLPLPHLEPGDRVRVRTDEGLDMTTTLRTFSIPLTPGTMSVGYSRDVLRMSGAQRRRARRRTRVKKGLR